MNQSSPAHRGGQDGRLSADDLRSQRQAGSGLRSSWGGSLVVAAVLAALVFVTVGMRVMEVGFYEDDFVFVTPWLDRGWEELRDWIEFAFVTWPQGRPLNHSLPQVLGFLGGAAPVPQGVHLIGLAGLLLNSFLVYRVLSRLFGPVAALLGASFYVLFPADTTRLLPIHMAEVQGGMTIALTGALMYLRGGGFRVASYAVAACSLLAYETTYLPFVFVPLALRWTSRRELWHRLRWHATAVGTTLALFAAVRLALREERLVLAGAEPLPMLWRAVTAPLIGAVVSGGRCILAPFEALGQAPGLAWLSAAVGALALASGVWLLSRARSAQRDSQSAQASPGEPAHRLFFGFAAVLGSYLLTFINYPPTFQFGRLTLVHSAAAFGASVLFAGVVDWLGSRGSAVARRAALPVTLAYLFGIGLFAGVIQEQYVRAWDLERRFWSSVVRECPDVGSGTAIFVTGEPPRQEKAIASFEWADSLVPAQLYDVASPPPNLVVWEVMGKNMGIKREGGVLSWSPRFWKEKRIPLDLDNVIVLEFAGSGVRRIDEWVVPGAGTTLQSKPLSLRMTPRISQGTFARALLW
jgi:hypothetical protein